MAEEVISKIATVLIAGIAGVGLSYQTLPFVCLVIHLEGAATSVAPILVKDLQLLKKFASPMLPSLAENSFFVQKLWGCHTKMTLLVLRVHGFTWPFRSNFVRVQP